MWKILANNTIKHEELLEANLESMYAVVLFICNPVLKDQVYNSEEYEDINNKEDTLRVLKCNRRIMYTNGYDDTNSGYNNVITVTNYY